MSIKKKSDAGWCFDIFCSPSRSFLTSKTEPVRHAGQILLNEKLAKDLGLNVEILRLDGPQVFAGNEIPSGAMPLALLPGISLGTLRISVMAGPFCSVSI